MIIYIHRSKYIVVFVDGSVGKLQQLKKSTQLTGRIQELE